jgi:multiple antibiotic resistance protein
MDAAFFLKSFVSLFVAIDLLGALPIFIGLTGDMEREVRNRLIYKSILTAFFIGMAFIFAGQAVFNFLGITENDFRIAGGLLLLIFSIRDLMNEGEPPVPGSHATLGVVPIGTPLIMGPAALATILVSVREFGLTVSLPALIINLGLVWLAFRNSHWILRILGRETTQAVGKICSLLLAAIAVMLIRVGLQGVLS